MNTVPTIVTERLVLRPHVAGDIDDIYAMWADPSTLRYIAAKPGTLTDAWMRILRHRGMWVVTGFGGWVISERATGSFVGELGFADYRRTIDPPLPAGPEIGWVLAASGRHRGYGSESVRAALHWGDRHLTTDRVCCIIDPQNTRSIRIATDNAFTSVGTAVLAGAALDIFVRERQRADGIAFAYEET